MAALDSTVDRVFQDWDEQRIKLAAQAADKDAAGKLGPFASIINTRMKTFVERWRPDRMKVLKRLGKQDNATPDSVRGSLTPLARDEFLADLKAYGIPDRYATVAASMLEVR
jgi:hypothetical protein